MPSFLTSPTVLPIVLLSLSNLFMTAAWYGHLKFPHMGMITAIVIAWLIAGLEYCFAVPANRIGIRAYDVAQLKTIQEIITLAVFVIFAVVVLDQKITWQHLLGFALIGLGATFIFHAPKG
jgi:uncharacterized protein (DUF486 family)